MEIKAESVDELLLELYSALLTTKGRNEGGTRGPCTELIGVTLRLSNARARLSRSENRGKPFSAVGELLWYLSGSERLDFIEPYVPHYKDDAEDGILPGAYGPRLLQMRGEINQVENVCNLLERKPSSKRAVIQLFNAEDLAGDFSEIPCTTTFQFHLRDEKLHMSVTMRSNDSFFGLPHDLFCFTMIQELVARRLGVEPGEYIHHVGSMHVYDRYISGVRSYVEAGYHRVDPMPPMPVGNQFPVVQQLVAAERKIRNGEWQDAESYGICEYWSDIVRLLQAFWASGKSERIDHLLQCLNNQVYSKYVQRRKNSSPREFKRRG